MDTNVATNAADVLGVIRALEEATESLHWIGVSDNPQGMRREAEECLKRISGHVLGEGGNVYRLPTVRSGSMNRVGAVYKLNTDIANEQALDRVCPRR